jgi:hypothetical protein
MMRVAVIRSAAAREFGGRTGAVVGERARWWAKGRGGGRTGAVARDQAGE